MQAVAATQGDDLGHGGHGWQVAPLVADDRRLAGQASAVVRRLLLGHAPVLVQEHGHQHQVGIALLQEVHVHHGLLADDAADADVTCRRDALDAGVVEDSQRLFQCGEHVLARDGEAAV